MLREDHDVSANLINMMLQRSEADSNNIDAPWWRAFEEADYDAVKSCFNYMGRSAFVQTWNISVCIDIW